MFCRYLRGSDGHPMSPPDHWFLCIHHSPLTLAYRRNTIYVCLSLPLLFCQQLPTAGMLSINPCQILAKYDQHPNLSLSSLSQSQSITNVSILHTSPKSTHGFCAIPRNKKNKNKKGTPGLGFAKFLTRLETPPLMRSGPNFAQF